MKMNVERPINSKQACAPHHERLPGSGSVGLRNDQGWAVTFELSFPPINHEDSTP